MADELVVNRWRRYGKDRLYVNLADGTRVGWVDLQTGDRVVEREDLRQQFEQAIATAMSDEAPPPATREPEPPPEPAPAPGKEPTHAEPYEVKIDFRDLAVNEAGRAAREQAVAAREAAPVRTTLARILGVHTEERAWRVGAVGEKKVAAQLAKLPEGWHVLHAVEVGNRGSDIDHIVIGPAGVFTVNAKHHPDASIWVAGNTFMVNGHRQPYIRNSRHEAARASKLLSAASGTKVEVTGVIAVVGATKGMTIKEQPKGVCVVGRRHLAQWLTYQPACLSGAAVKRLYDAARRSSTWTT